MLIVTIIVVISFFSMSIRALNRSIKAANIFQQMRYLETALAWAFATAWCIIASIFMNY